MPAALFGTAFLAFFVLSPLRWVELGVPWLTLVITFVLIPLLDAAVGLPRPGSQRTVPACARWIPRLQLPLQAVLLVQAVRIAPTLDPAPLLVFALAVGAVTGGLGITIAHELGHRASKLDRWIAKALLVSVCYGHFFVEHVRGHHVRVATPDDPATAPLGMNVYRFILRSVLGSCAHAWRLEALRLERQGRSRWSVSNWVLSGSLLSLALLAVAAWSGGGKAALFFLVQSAVAIALLEVINYVEHYGLARRRIDGRYEPVRAEHSWNADYVVSNWILFNLQLHSDHHAHMQRPYEELRTMPQAPQLPAGYPAMVLLALVPPLWFATMNPRVPVALPIGPDA
ncbi:MAG TPA: alkane 1-monooxygenase [Burkholderiaceae bacterium]|nr:alkane 1-monooxygenase [Burkholderiaceae bacterium]